MTRAVVPPLSARRHGRRTARVTVLGGLLLAVPLGGCLARGDDLTSVYGIPVAEGVNQITHLVPDGRSGLIVEGSLRGGAPDTVVVMLPRLTPSRGWDVVGVENPETGVVTGTIPSVAGERQAALFARAKRDGIPVTVMFVATGTGRVGAPSAFTIETYRLSTGGDDGSGLPAVFDPIHRLVTRDAYCSPQAALADAERIGPLAVPRDGCGVGPVS